MENEITKLSFNQLYWLTGRSKRRVERFWKVVSLLEENSRMSLMEMSRKLKVPVSTLFETLNEVEPVSTINSLENGVFFFQ